MERCLVLLVDSDAAGREALAASLEKLDCAIEPIAHEDAVAHISREDMSRYAAVIIAASDEPSTLSSSFRLGEYVLHYMTQMCPEVLRRVIVVAPRPLPPSFAPAGRVLIEPYSVSDLVSAIDHARR